MLPGWKRRSKRQAWPVRCDRARFGLTWWYVPASAVLTLPSVAFAHLDGVQLAARSPEPVTIGKRWHPAFSTAGRQDGPSPTTLAPGSVAALASLSTSRLRKPFTTVSRRRLGFLSAVVSTAATIGALPAAPRPRSPPWRPPPRWASSISTRPEGFGSSASRAAIARISSCSTHRAVGCRTPSRRASPIELIPPSLRVRRWIAANQAVSGGVVPWNTAPAVSETRFVRRLHRNTLRVVGAQEPRWPRAGRVNPSRQRTAKGAPRHAAAVPNRSRNAASLRPRTARRDPSADAIPPPPRPRNLRESCIGSGWVSWMIRYTFTKLSRAHSRESRARRSGPSGGVLPPS